VSGDRVRPKVLVVDDEPHNLELVHRALRHRYDVVLANNPDEALGLLHEGFICILCDQKMPGMVGTEFLAMAHERAPNAVRILLTGYSDIEAVIEAINRGRVTSYVKKPCHPDDLLRVVAEAAQMHALNEQNRSLVAELEQANAQLEEQRQLLAKTVEEKTRLLMEAEARLEALSTHDALTGLHNHRFFHERLDAELRRAERGGHPVTVVVIDLDGFQLYNDRFGHSEGDSLLLQLAGCLSESCRALADARVRTPDVLSRFAGDQFAALFPDTDKEGGLIAAQRIRQAVEGGQFHGMEVMPKGHLTVSIGIAEYPTDAQNRGNLVRAATAAVHEAKLRGHGQTVSYPIPPR
jgi:diguanylate cyclase (GGDEF)-like protein